MRQRVGTVSYTHLDVYKRQDAGRRIAERTYERHRLLTQLFTRLGVDEETASADACRIEHYISDATFDALKRHAGLESEKG